MSNTAKIVVAKAISRLYTDTVQTYTPLATESLEAMTEKGLAIPFKPYDVSMHKTAPWESLLCKPATPMPLHSKLLLKNSFGI